MRYLLALLVLLTAYTQPADSSTNSEGEIPETGLTAPVRSLHFLPSIYGSLGTYSTSTRSRSASAFCTVSDSWRDYYTIGFSTLWLERDESGGKYYTQHLLTARASWFAGPQIVVAGHYVYLHERSITSLSSPADFHLVGAGSSYWFSYDDAIGMSATIAVSGGGIEAVTVRTGFSHHFGEGIWVTSNVTAGNTTWTPWVAAWRQSLTVPLGDHHLLVASVDIGRRIFYFDDELLVLYNQREIQTRFFQLRGVIHVGSQIYLLPSVEHDRFETYNVTYASVGARMVF